MRLAFARLPPSGDLSLRRRATTLSITIAVHLLLLWLLLRLAPPQVTRPQPGDPLMTFDVSPERKAAPKPRATAKARSAERPKPRAAIVPPPQIAATMPALIPGLEKFDLRNVQSSVASADDGSRGDGAGAGAGAGEGPGGARLYNAEWYREPTQAQLAYYLPARPQTGWGMIACQTVERYRVENCREIGNEPPGSGLARAVRQAAWQFLVRPPRIDGKPVIGAWVRIRIEFTETGAVIDRSTG